MREFRISEVCNVISGGTPSTKISSYWNGDVVWLTPKDLSNNKSKYIYDSENKITEEGLSRSSTQLLPPNTVLLSSRAPIGYLAIAGKSLCTNQGFKSMVCNQDLIIPEYLYYLLQTKVEDFNNISTGSTFKELSSSLLKQYKISIHDLPEQSHIVDILGTLDDKIENNEKITILLLKKIQFYYIEKFLKKSKTLVPFQYFIDSTIGGDWGKDEPSKSNNTKVICIRGADISDISQGKEGSPPTRFILEKNCKLKKLCAWDIIVEISGGSPTQSTGRSTLITNYLLDLYNTPIICTNFCRAIKCKKVEYAPYVYAAFNYLYNTNVFFNYENGTTGIKNLDLDAILNEQEVYLPSESELVDFYNYTKDIQEQVMRLRTENQKLNELKQLYLKKFFG